MNIFEFYKEHESKYGQISDPLKDEKEKILEDAKPGALAKLKTLCGKDEKLMFGVLQYILNIPISKEIHEFRAAYKRKMAKKIKDKEIKLNKKIRRQVKKRYERLPVNDLEAFKDRTIKALMLDKRLKLDAEDLNKLKQEYENWKKKTNRQGKANPFFKDIIYKTFLISKENTGLEGSKVRTEIANLLNSLKFKTPQGKPFTNDNIKTYCNPIS